MGVTDGTCTVDNPLQFDCVQTSHEEAGLSCLPAVHKQLVGWPRTPTSVPSAWQVEPPRSTLLRVQLVLPHELLGSDDPGAKV